MNSFKTSQQIKNRPDVRHGVIGGSTCCLVSGLCELVSASPFIVRILVRVLIALHRRSMFGVRCLCFDVVFTASSMADKACSFSGEKVCTASGGGVKIGAKRGTRRGFDWLRSTADVRY